MAADVPAQMRRRVAERAGHRCEYCLLPQKVAFHQHEPDHISDSVAERQHLMDAGLYN